MGEKEDLRSISRILFYLATGLGLVIFGIAIKLNVGNSILRFAIVGTIITPILTILRLVLDEKHPVISGLITLLFYGITIIGCISSLYLWKAAKEESSKVD